MNLLKPYFCRAYENAVPGAEIKLVALVTEVSNFSLGMADCRPTEEERVPPDCIVQP